MSLPGIKRNSSPPFLPEASTVWLTWASPLSTACQGLTSPPYSRVISWLTVSHSFITFTRSRHHQLQVYRFCSVSLIRYKCHVSQFSSMARCQFSGFVYLCACCQSHCILWLSNQSCFSFCFNDISMFSCLKTA